MTAGRLRVLLATLALSAGQGVPVSRLVAAVWGEQPPVNPRRGVQTYVTRLRAMVGGDLISTRPDGYALELEPDAVDVLCFGRLLDSATAAGDPATRRSLLTEAIGLWRGEPFEGLDSEWLGLRAPRLVERYLAAVEDRADLDLATADRDRRRAVALVAPLRELTARHPLRESLWVRLLLTLAQCGRRAEALARYETMRARLADELGTDPGPQLQRIHADLLAGTGPTVPAQPPVPRQLPAVPPGFVGRAAELAALVAGRTEDGTPSIDARNAGAAETVVITAIGGMAGVGKTALALRAAHDLADRYPDGQLFLDLHGHTRGVAPMDPADALDRLLRDLGVSAEAVPGAVAERAALYRSRLAGRRVLVLLDNAADEAQVEPLMPGTAGCQVLITSRRRLAGLDRTHVVSLDTLPLADGVTVFGLGAGERRLPAADVHTVAEIVRLCGGLPLAIRIASARLRAHPHWSMMDLLERLRDRHRLAELEAGHRSVTAALELSYRQLPPDQRRAYRLLGVHPGADVDAYALAALADTTPVRSRRLLERLLEAYLVEERAAGRYAFHDLVRAHAAVTADQDEPEPQRRAALDRLVDHYTRTAEAAADAAYPYDRPRRGDTPTAFRDAVAAVAWLDAELPHLLAVARYAAGHGRPDRTVRLSGALLQHLRVRSRYAEAERLHGIALAAAQETGDRVGELRALIALGTVHRRLDRDGPAVASFGGALALARDTGDRDGELEALVGLGHLDRKFRRLEAAAARFGEVLAIARETGFRAGEADALIGLGRVELLRHRFRSAVDNFAPAASLGRQIGYRTGEMNATAGLGDGYRLLDEPELAEEKYRRALTLAIAIGDRNWELEARHGLGRLSHGTGRPERALEEHGRALRLATDLGQRADQARAHDGLARANHTLGRRPAARRHWQAALEILADLGVTDTEEGEVTAAAIAAGLAGLSALDAKPMKQI
jgi:DNA-binding SARP family transcriptional activator/tetratricopeptide (TPR) repeat protein